MTGKVSVLSRSPRKVVMAVAEDRRRYEIPARPATGGSTPFEVDADFLVKWAAANWDAEILDLLQWPGKPATRRADAWENGARPS